MIEVRIGDPRLARAVRKSIDDAVRRASGAGMGASSPPPVVRLRTRRRLAELRDLRERVPCESQGLGARLAGAIAVVAVTRGNARHLPAMVDAIRSAFALGVQLVWDGHDPERARVEAHVFAVLEHARRTPGEAPVVISTSDAPEASLRILIAARHRKETVSS